MELAKNEKAQNKVIFILIINTFCVQESQTIRRKEVMCKDSKTSETAEEILMVFLDFSIIVSAYTEN